MTPFRCPSCLEPLVLERHGAERMCGRCRRISEGASGVLDFVVNPDRAEERAYYEDEYGERPVPEVQRDISEL